MSFTTIQDDKACHVFCLGVCKVELFFGKAFSITRTDLSNRAILNFCREGSEATVSLSDLPNPRIKPLDICRGQELESMCVLVLAELFINRLGLLFGWFSRLWLLNASARCPHLYYRFGEVTVFQNDIDAAEAAILDDISKGIFKV